MFCPNCGTENSKAQKFCTRCGTNLLAIDRAREIITEMNSNVPAPSVSPNLVFVTVALLSIVGFIAVTAGTVEMFNRDSNRSPFPIFFAFGGFASLVMICRYLLGLIRPGARVEAKPTIQSPSASFPTPTFQRGTTNRALNEAAMPHHSVVEDPTRQFEHDTRSNS